MRRHFRPLPFVFAAAAAAAVVAASCLNDSTGPASVPGVLALAPSFASGAAGLVDVDRARILIERDPGNVVVVDSIHPIAPGADEIDLVFDDIPITSPENVFTLTLTLISPLGDTVFRYGPAPVEVFPEGEEPEPMPVALTYVGPGSHAVSVAFLTADGSLFFDEEDQVAAQAMDEDGEPVPEAPIKYNALDPVLLVVLDDSTGEIQAQSQRGPGRVEAELLTGQKDTVSIVVQPVPVALAVATGDAQTGVPGQPLPLPLVLEVTAADGLGVQDVDVLFSSQDGGSFTPNAAGTDAEGRVMAVWTLGTNEGTQTGEATALSADLQVSFTAEALPLEPIRVMWIDDQGGSWSDPANWSPRLPLAIDTAVIDLVGDYTVVLDVSTTVASLELGGASGTQALQVDGTTFTSDGAITIGANGVLELVDGTMTGMGTITSGGIVRANGSSSVIENPVVNSGTIDAQLGALTFTGGGIIGGSATIQPSGVLVFTAGTYDLEDGFSGTGGGIVAIGGAVVNVPVGTVDIDILEIVSGTLGGNGEVSVATAFVWAGGTMTDGGITVLEQTAAAEFIANPGPLVLSGGRELENNGTLIWAGDVLGEDGAVLRNFGTLAVQVTDAAFLWDQVSDRPTLDNQGGLNITVGTFDVDVTLVHAQGALLQGRGTLALDDAITEAFEGNIQPGGPGDVGVLTVSLGQNNLLFGSTTMLDLDINGPTAGVDHDQLAFTGSGTVTVNGALQANLGIAPAFQDQFTILTYPASDGSFGSDNLDPTMRVSFSATEGILQQFAPPTATAIWEGNVDSDWFNAANWNTGVEPGVSDNVFIPAGTPNDPTVAPEQFASVNDLTVDEGASLSIQDAATVSTTGNDDAGFTSITGATLEMAGSGVTVRGAVPNLFVTGSVRVLDNVVASSITVDDGSFDVGSGEARVTGDFATVGIGTLVMTDPAATLITSGGFFGGGGTTDLLTAGTIQVTGPFVEGNGSPDAFAPSGTHLVAFVGDGTIQTVNFVNRTSFFHELEVANTADVLFQSDVIVNGSVTVREDGTLTAGEAGELITIGGDLTTLDQGVLATAADGATIQLAGNATFAGGSTARFLDVGTLVINGSLTQGSASSTTSFAPGQFFETQFTGVVEQQVSFDDAGPNASHFGTLTIANSSGGVSLQTQASAVGQLTTNLGGLDLLILGNGNTLEVAGVNADSIIFDNAPLVVVDGATWSIFDGITFRNMPVDQAQLSVVRPGNILDMGLSAGAMFETQPDIGAGGVYVHAEDTSADQNPLVINVFNPSPVSINAGETSTGGEAIVNWNPA